MFLPIILPHALYKTDILLGSLEGTWVACIWFVDGTFWGGADFVPLEGILTTQTIVAGKARWHVGAALFMTVRSYDITPYVLADVEVEIWARSEMEAELSYETSKSSSQWPTSPAMPCTPKILKPPQTVPHLETKCSNSWAWGRGQGSHSNYSSMDTGEMGEPWRGSLLTSW